MSKPDVNRMMAEVESTVIRDLKKDNLNILKQLEKAKKKKEDMVDAVYEAVSANLRTWDKPSIPKPRNLKKTKDVETAIAVLSDIQLAKVTPDYNSEIAEERVIAYANKIVDITNVQRQSHPVNKVAVFAVGDIVEGELIFPGQSHLIDSSLYKQVTVDGPRIMTKFFDILLANFNEVVSSRF